jgi:sugar/nucleoside kinase (ribokinase family)
MRAAPGGPVLVAGDVMVDVVAELRAPLEPGSDTPAAISLLPGGSAANTAAWLVDAGVPTELVAAVGDDVLGREQLADLRARGVVLRVAVVPTLATGTVIALIDASGDRSFVTERGANAGLAAAITDDPAAPALDAGWGLHVSGHALLAADTRPAARRLLARALAASATVSVDAASAAPLRRAGGAAWLEWTEGATVCFANLDEGRAVTGRDRPADVAAGLAEHYPEVVLKLGAAGCLLQHGTRRLSLPASPVGPVVDTVGAGDAFAAGYLAARRRREVPEAALAAGAVTAGRAVAVRGGRPPGSTTRPGPGAPPG